MHPVICPKSWRSGLQVVFITLYPCIGVKSATYDNTTLHSGHGLKKSRFTLLKYVKKLSVIPEYEAPPQRYAVNFGKYYCQHNAIEGRKPHSTII